MNRKILALALMMTVSGMAQAGEAIPVKPGLWEIKGTTTNPFTGSKSFSRTQCMTEDGFGPETMMKDVPEEACKVTSTVSGNTIDYDMDCQVQGQQMTGSGSITIDADTAQGQMTMRSTISGQTFEIKSSSSGKRIGDC